MKKKNTYSKNSTKSHTKMTSAHSHGSSMDSIAKVMTNSGDVAGYELSCGKQVSKAEAIKMAKNGDISGVNIATAANGKEYLRSTQDGTASNNLRNLPHEEMN